MKTNARLYINGTLTTSPGTTKLSSICLKSQSRRDLYEAEFSELYYASSPLSIKTPSKKEGLGN